MNDVESRTQSPYTGDFEDIKGKKYLRAHSAIDWFHTDYPIPSGRIVTVLLSEKPILWRAEIYVANDLVATGHAYETSVNKDMGKLETNAVRRALAYSGYGTESAIGDDDFDSETGQSLPKRDSQQKANGKGDVAMAKAHLGNGGPRVIGRDPLKQAGEELGAVVTWTRDDVRRFEDRWVYGTNMLSRSDLLTALGVDKYGEWTQGENAADERVAAWLQEQLKDATTTLDQVKW